jgi:hypothetical protein
MTAIKRRTAYLPTTGIHKGGGPIYVPTDVERREMSSPCFMCESRGPCRHREAA